MKKREETNKNTRITKEQLENRLYDQGFSHYTMPSVIRKNNKELQ